MTLMLDATLASRYPGGTPPDWVLPFKKAVAELELLLRKNEDGIAERDGEDGDASEERGMGREEEMASIGDAEADLRSAIDKSHQKEPLPYMWLSALYERLGRYTEARKAAQKASALDPLSPGLLFRLSGTYELEKDYVKALENYARALSILPVFERSTHDGKLARLKEQAEDAREHVVRVDPFEEKLPHEVLLSVMQYGLDSDRDFVLGCTWVSRRWRDTLLNSPTLWRTLSFDAGELKNKKSEEKRKAFIERSGRKIHTVEFRNLMLSSIGKIHKNDRQPCNTAKHLNISVASPLVLDRLSTKFYNAFSKLEHLRINGGYEPHFLLANSHYRRGPSPRALHCDFIEAHESILLQHLELDPVDFRLEEAPMSPATWDKRSTAGNADRYTALRTLISNKCAFMNGYHTPVRQADRWQSDPLHRALRTTTALETLIVIPEEKISLTAAQPGIGKKCTLTALRSLTLPPPSVWALDIVAPNVEVLKFRLPSELPHVHDLFLKQHARPLVPALHHSPVPQDMLWKLAHVEFPCFDLDKIERLESWIPHLANVKTLAIRGFRGSRGPYPKASHAEGPDDHVQIKILESLIRHPEWLNKLEELRLDVCYTPDQALIDFVTMRTAPAAPVACTPLKRMVLRYCSKLDVETIHRLDGMLDSFESKWNIPPPKPAAEVNAAD